MKNIVKKFQENMTAATFAEAGEWDTAREIAPDTGLSKEATWMDRIFAAITFAESGLHSEAVHSLEQADIKCRELASSKVLPRETTWMDRIFSAVTFAEAGLPHEAVRTLETAAVRNRGFNSVLAEELGLKGVKLMYGTVSI